MKISRLIERLQELMAIWGDLHIECWISGRNGNPYGLKMQDIRITNFENDESRHFGIFL